MKNDILHEITPLERGKFLFVRENIKDVFTYPIHQHPEIELNFIDNSEGRVRVVGDSVEECGHRDLALIAGGLEHTWGQPEGYPLRKVRELTFQFAPDLMSNDLLQKEHFSSIRELLTRAERGVAFGQAAISRALPLLEELAYAEEGFYQYIRLLELLYVLSKEEDCHVLSSSQFANVALTSDSRRIRKVTKYMDEHFREVLRLPNLASMVGMTPSSFSRFFLQHTHRTPTDYLIDKRIGYAARRLVDSSDSVAEVCYDCGFSTLSNFNRLFKAKKGVTPTQFRENYDKRKIVLDFDKNQQAELQI